MYKFKTKTNTHLIIYADNYITNTEVLISDKFIILDNELLNYKISKNEPFNYNTKLNRFNENIPKLKDLVPQYVTGKPLKDTNLYHITSDKQVYKIFYNEEAQDYTYFNTKYLEILPPDTTLLQENNIHSAAYVFEDNKCVFMVMSFKGSNSTYLK